jgi:hypothetical protein
MTAVEYERREAGRREPGRGAPESQITRAGETVSQDDARHTL